MGLLVRQAGDIKGSRHDCTMSQNSNLAGAYLSKERNGTNVPDNKERRSLK